MPGTTALPRDATTHETAKDVAAIRAATCIVRHLPLGALTASIVGVT